MGATYQPPQWLVPNMGPGNVNKVGNYSFQFDGTADWINCGEIPPLFKYFPIGTAKDTAWSASMWVKGSSAGGFFEIPYVESNALNAFSFGFAFSTYLYFGGKYAGIKIKETGVTAFSTTNWNHIVMTFDGVDNTAVSSYTLYVDNVSIAIELIVPHITDFRTENISIGVAGSDGSAIYWDGQMSEVSLFNYELSAGNVTTLYGSADAGVGNPMALDVIPLGYWKGDRAALGAQWAVPNQGVSHNYALAFSSGYVTTPPWSGYQGLDASASAVSSSHITLSCWFRAIDAIGTKSFYFWRANTGSFRLQEPTDRLFVTSSIHGGIYRYWDSTTVVPDILDGGWYNIVLYIPNSTAPAQWDATNAAYYINGIEVGGGTNIGGTPLCDEITDIYGLFHGISPGSCEISNWAYWLSDERANISTIFNNGIPGDLTSLSPDVWWKLDADNVTIASQVDVTDSSGNAVTGAGPLMSDTTFPALVGTDVNAAGGTFVTDYSFEFDGVGDYIDCGQVSIFNSATAITMSGWFKQDALDVINFMFGTLTSLSDCCTVYTWSNGNMYVHISDGLNRHSWIDYSTVVTAGEWFHLAMVYDGSGVADADKVKLYINNSLMTLSFNGAPPASINATQSDFYIGSAATYTATQGWNGLVSNAAVWNSALSAANITTIFNNGRPADLTSLSPTSWWKMGQEAFCPDYSAAPNVWTIPDQIGSNDGTSAGNPDLVGEAPQSFANGLSVSMDIDDRIGESGFSDDNALSYNMDSEARVEDVPA